MDRSRSEILSQGNARVMFAAYTDGRVEGKLMGGGGTGHNFLDLVKLLGETFLPTNNSLEQQALIQSAAAAQIASRTKIDRIFIELEAALNSRHYEPLSESERQEFQRNAEAARERGRTDMLERDGHESGISEIPHTESWREDGDTGSVEPEWTPERLAALDAEIDALMTRILQQLKELKELLESIDHIKDQTQTASTIPSPIILDLDGTGINTVGLAAGVHFDHAADGFAERTGWVGSGDGLLVWDRNGNGVIDSGRELFGSETVLGNGLQAVNGFAALAELDANGDGVIDANDPLFAELRVWVDADLNGRTGEGELLTLEEAGVQAIHVAYANSGYVDANGNEHRQVGSFVTTDGETRTATDVWFRTDAAHSVPTEWADIPEAIALLPDWVESSIPTEGNDMLTGAVRIVRFNLAPTIDNLYLDNACTLAYEGEFARTVAANDDRIGSAKGQQWGVAA